jgi:hypothetical protein
MFLFAALPSLIAALILKDDKGAIAFVAPTVLLTASALPWSRDAGNAPAGAVLLAGLGISVASMLQCARLRRRAQDLH